MSVGLYAYAHAGTGEAVNAWVKSYDPDAFDGRGDAAFTSDPDEALRFEHAGEALEFWKQTSVVRPVRPDGRPNRPLTAFTVGVQQIP